jgi:nucleotide-binding universal stress UspA family protein
MTGSIICGVDDSESAEGAARVARCLSSRLGLRLVFVRVVEAGSPDEKISATAERLGRLSECKPALDCGAGWLVEVGHPADRLVAAAAEEEAALIVVGSTGPRSSLRGSISAEISRRAPCPVVVVPPGADGYSASGRGRTQPDVRSTRFPGLADDGYTGSADGFARSGLGPAGHQDAQAPGNDANALEFAGGIVRFSRGGSREAS